MRIKIFRATTLAGAMNQIREELGLDALILDTKSLAGSVEVTAALEPEDEPDLPPLVPDRRSAGSDERRSGAYGDLAWHGLPPAISAAFAMGSLETGCSRLFRFARLPLDADAPPLLLAGPPGAGKTLTIAKLATRLVMEGHRPLVITADERRAGAVEQLAAFTRLLGLTLIAAGRPEMLERALSRREPLSPVLIDAPGLDIMDPSENDVLASLVAASGSRTTLVLPAGLDPAEASEVAEAHAALGADLLLATRLDRSRRLGGILAASYGTGLALTEVGIGPDVAAGLVPLSPAGLALRLAETPAARSRIPCAQPPAAIAPSLFVQPDNRTAAHALALHIAAQQSASRSVSWKVQP